MTKYNPKAHGANCDECPLNKQKPVPPEPVAYKGTGVICAESPGHSEEERGRPLIGSSGFFLKDIFTFWRVRRDHYHLTNAVLCRPPKKLKPTEWAMALKCCRPRLEKELHEVGITTGIRPTIMAYGNKALLTLTGKDGIFAWRGYPLDGWLGFQRFQVVPSLHPAYALRVPSYIPILRLDFGRFIQVCRNELPIHRWPNISTGGPTLKSIARLEAISRPKVRVVGIDVETAGVNPMESKLICVGLAAGTHATTIRWPPNDAERHLLHKILNDKKRIIVGHNIQHDLLTLRANGIKYTAKPHDTLLQHSVIAPQIKHDLGTCYVNAFPAERWKSEFHGGVDEEGEKDSSKLFNPQDSDGLRRLLTYNVKDSVAAERLYKFQEKLLHRTTHRGRSLYEERRKLGTDVVVRMKERGVRVDLGTLEKHRVKLNDIMAHIRAKWDTMVKKAGLEPKDFQLGKTGSTRSMRTLFFEKLGCKPTSYTDEGEPQLTGEILNNFLGTYNDVVTKFATELLNYRKAGKLLSVYVEGLEYDSKQIVRPTWKVYGTITGRWASKAPNMQNVPKPMRDLFIPRKKGLFVAADYSQLELRLIAALAGEAELLEAYRKGEDVHMLNAKALFRIGQPDDKQRNAAKQLAYAFNYNVSEDVTTVWKTLVGKGMNIGIQELQRLRKAWFQNRPAIAKWQRDEIAKAKETHYVETAISGRREYFHDGRPEPNKVLNYPVQGTAGDLMNKAMLEVHRGIHWSGTEGICFQVHDEIVIEGPERAKHRLTNLLRDAMTQTVTLNGNEVTFPVDVAIGHDFYNLKEI